MAVPDVPRFLLGKLIFLRTRAIRQYRYAGGLGVVGMLALLAVVLTGCDALVSSGNAASMPSAASISTNAVQDYNQAQALRQSGYCDRAIPIYLRAINKNRMYVNAYRALGACYQDAKVGNLNAAIAMYDKAIQIDPTNFGIYIDRAGAEANNGNTGAATSDDLMALQLAPRQVPSYLSIAQSLDSFQDLADEVKAISMAIAVVPGAPSLYEQRAQVYMKMSDTPDALADYNRAIKVAPYTALRASVYADLADVYSGQQNYDSAFQAGAAAIALQPANANLYIRSGNIHQNAGDFTGALKLYDQALQRATLQTDVEAAHAAKGDTFVKMLQPTAAFAEYRQAARLASDDGTRAALAGDIASVADMFSGQQNYKAAFGASAEAVKLQPDNPSLYMRAGIIRQTAGDYVGALKLYDGALRHATAQSDVETAYEAKGDAYTKMHQADKAIAEYKQALHVASDASTIATLNGKIKALSARSS